MMPLSEDSSASVCAAFHLYDASTQLFVLVRQRNSVSTLLPLDDNSFQNFVPTGSSQLARSATSIIDPAGRRTQRRFAAPSLHSGYAGENVRLRESIFNVAASA